MWAGSLAGGLTLITHAEGLVCFRQAQAYIPESCRNQLALRTYPPPRQVELPAATFDGYMGFMCTLLNKIANIHVLIKLCHKEL